MITPDYCRTMARYNRWQNERLYALCAGLTDDARRLDRGAPFRSIHGTLNHLLLGDRIWMGRLTGSPIAVASLAEEVCETFEQLSRERTAMDARIEAWAEAITEARLAAVLEFQAVARPGIHAAPFWFCVAHFFNHQTHHRGQLTALIEQAGADCGLTDLLFLPEGPCRPRAGQPG